MTYLRTLVLDLDETLIHTFDREEHENLDLSKAPAHLLDQFYILDFYYSDTYEQEHIIGIRRPNLDYFLRSARKLYDLIVVYTAAKYEYARQVVRAIFDNSGHPPPDFIFTREDCVTTKDGLTKPLSYLLELSPELAALTNVEHMVILDDQHRNFLFNPENGIEIAMYKPEPYLEALIEEDLYLLAALEHLKKRSDKMKEYANEARAQLRRKFETTRGHRRGLVYH